MRNSVVVSFLLSVEYSKVICLALASATTSNFPVLSHSKNHELCCVFSRGYVAFTVQPNRSSKPNIEDEMVVERNGRTNADARVLREPMS